jgi:hypothetical protein
MKLLKKLLQLAGLLALLPIGTAVHAQIAGGTLYSAAPGPVTLQLLGYNVPSSVNTAPVNGWETFASWVTGPGFYDWQTTRSYAPPSGRFGGGFNGSDATVGRTISTPALAAGTLTTMASAFYIGGTDLAAGNDVIIGVVHTGWPAQGSGGFGAAAYWMGSIFRQTLAMVFPNADNTARVGFMVPGMTAPSNFSDYSVRILVGNVCVR